MWYVYILRCSDHSLYTGVTTDIERRFEEHKCKKSGAKYTKTRRPIAIVYFEKKRTRTNAQKREAEIKNMKKEEKERLISRLKK